MSLSEGKSATPDSVTGDEKERVEPTRQIVDFNVEELQDIVLDGPPRFAVRDLMSPFVWKADDRYGIMVRAVPQQNQEKTDTGEIWAGWSEDSVSFKMLERPAIVAGLNGETRCLPLPVTEPYTFSA